jgi:hypothetical protein
MYAVASELLRVPQSEVDLVQDIISDPRGGIIKLLGSGERLESAGIRGGGAYYDFVRRDQQYGHGSDIGLIDGALKTGFAGANYGYILRLGRCQLREVLVDAADKFPSVLRREILDAWKFMWEYRPPREMKEIRKHQRGARNRLINNIPVSETSTAEEGMSYLLRSVQIDDHDVLVAIHVQRMLSDRSVILPWRILRIFDTPVAIRSEEE